MLWAWLLSIGWGADCPDVDLDDWKDALDATDAALTGGRLPEARQLVAGTVQVLPCLEVVVPKELLARYARQRAFLLMTDQEAIDANSWFQLARAVDPQGAWPDYVPGRHSARDLSREPPPPRGRAEGAGLVVPSGGGVFLDGRYLVEPVAEAEIPHLLQVADGEGKVTFAGWQQGAVFPEQVLGEEVSVPPAPQWFTNPVDVGKQRAERRSKRLLAASGLAVLAGGLFGGAHLARTSYQAHPSDGLRTVVNGTTVASGVVGTSALVALVSAAAAR